MNSLPQEWVEDLKKNVAIVPYGTINVQIRRERHKTIGLTVDAEETLRYVDNDEAKNDIQKLLDNLVTSKFSGEVHLKLRMKEGNIQLLGIFDKKETSYY